MTKIAIVIDGERTYPILRLEGKYRIDFGGSVGMSDPLSFKRDTEAIAWFRKTFSSDIATVLEA